jgi:CBS-domain-containing membrane protein
MPSIDQSSFTALPVAIQWAILVGGLIVGGLLAYSSYNKGRQSPPSTDFVLTAGQVTDMRPVRQIAESLAHIDQHFEDFGKWLERKAEADLKATEALEGILEFLQRQSAYEQGRHDGARGRRD